MQVSLIITVLGEDQPGLVNAISEILESHNGGWTESRMAHLAGKFAGILQVSAPQENIQALTEALDDLQNEKLNIQLEVANNTRQVTTTTLDVELLCQDRLGIIKDITEVLTRLNVNIEELDSHVKEASMAGGLLFSAELKLGLPENVSVDTVEEALEEMSDQFMIDIKLT